MTPVTTSAHPARLLAALEPWLHPAREDYGPVSDVGVGSGLKADVMLERLSRHLDRHRAAGFSGSDHIADWEPGLRNGFIDLWPVPRDPHGRRRAGVRS